MKHQSFLWKLKSDSAIAFSDTTVRRWFNTSIKRVKREMLNSDSRSTSGKNGWQIHECVFQPQTEHSQLECLFNRTTCVAYESVCSNVARAFLRYLTLHGTLVILFTYVVALCSQLHNLCHLKEKFARSSLALNLKFCRSYVLSLPGTQMSNSAKFSFMA